MTAPVVPNIPAIDVDATPANPHSSGLYTAATVIDTEDRLGFGVRVYPVNEGAHGQWPTGCDPDVPDDLRKTGDRPGPSTFAGTVVWTTDECSLVGTTVEESTQRARQLMRLYEQLEVEAFVADELLDRAGTPATLPAGADGLKRALGAVELALAKTGMVGTIHASRALAPLLNDFIVPGQGGKLTTKLGNVWAFGGGYETLGDTIVGTGPVTVRRGSIDVHESIDPRQNQLQSLAEREIVVSWESVTVAQTIA